MTAITASARDISIEVRISEKDVYEHLMHIQNTISKSDRTLIITPAECRKYRFVLKKRERLNKPGKYPVTSVSMSAGFLKAGLATAG